MDLTSDWTCLLLQYWRWICDQTAGAVLAFVFGCVVMHGWTPKWWHVFLELHKAQSNEQRSIVSGSDVNQGVYKNTNTILQQKPFYAWLICTISFLHFSRICFYASDVRVIAFVVLIVQFVQFTTQEFNKSPCKIATNFCKIRLKIQNWKCEGKKSCFLRVSMYTQNNFL